MLNITSNFDDNSTAFRTNKIYLLINVLELTKWWSAGVITLIST